MQPEIKSFRLTTKKKHSIRSYSQEKAESSSSEQSSFSVEYHSLTKRLKIKANQIRQVPLGSTVSSFGGLNSFRIRTQTSASRSLHKKHESGLVLFSMSDKKQRVEKPPQNFRYSTNVLNETKGLKFTSQNFKCRKNFKIQRPSIYWQIPQQDNEINLFKQSKQNKTKNSEQLQFSRQNNIPKQKFLQNCILLWKIRKQICSKSNKVKPKDVIKAIKAYIMRKQIREDPSNSMQKIFKGVEDQNDYKEILACQRIIVIGVVELINAEKLHYLCVQLTYILDNLIGFYLFLLGQLFQKSMFQTGSEQLNKLQQQTQAEAIEHKTSLTSTLLFLCTKLQTVFRYSNQLLKRLKGALANAKKASINRTFYDILTVFAVYLNQSEGQKSQNQYLSKYIASFLTCPSPFIIQPRSSNKNYTLVIDLDETICHTKLDSNNTSKYGTVYRPFCTQLFKKVSEKYQIIIFTSSISSYAEQVIAPFFDYVAHILCREHTTKVKGGAIKDLSRIGRSLETTLMVDNIADNFKLQTENGILINSWYGQKNDRQLQKLEQILLKVVAVNPKDIRQQLKRVLSQKQ